VRLVSTRGPGDLLVAASPTRLLAYRTRLPYSPSHPLTCLPPQDVYALLGSIRELGLEERTGSPPKLESPPRPSAG
jgi:hypothetical protein